MKHTLRCMKNEVGFAYEACLRHTEKLVCASLHGRCKRLLHGNEVDASYSPRRMLHSFRRPIYILGILWYNYLGSYLLDKIEFVEFIATTSCLSMLIAHGII